MPTATVSLSIQGMSCASCVGRVDRALAAVDGVTSVAVNLATEQARIAFAPDRVTPATIAAASTELGYPARIADRSTTVDRGTRRS